MLLPPEANSDKDATMSSEQENLPNCHDGYHVLRDDSATEIKLGVRIRADAKVLYEAFFWRFPTTNEGHGGASRLEYLLEAICLYLNAGGRPAMLDGVAGTFQDLAAGYAIAWPKSWSFLAFDGAVQHPWLIFRDKATPDGCIVMEPCVFIERQSLNDLAASIQR